MQYSFLDFPPKALGIIAKICQILGGAAKL